MKSTRLNIAHEKSAHRPAKPALTPVQPAFQPEEAVNRLQAGLGRPADLLNLQQSYGNQAVNQLLARQPAARAASPTPAILSLIHI